MVGGDALHKCYGAGEHRDVPFQNPLDKFRRGVDAPLAGFQIGVHTGRLRYSGVYGKADIIGGVLGMVVMTVMRVESLGVILVFHGK